MRSWKTVLASAAVIYGLVLTSGAVAAPGGATPSYVIDETKLPFEPIAGSTASWGVDHGAAYRIEVPANWNGELAVWAHGYQPGNELLVDNIPIREHLIENGYAWASTSYRTTAYNAEVAAEDLKNLIGVFRSKVAKPSRVYAVGGSMGGHVVKRFAEKWPNLASGALAMCGGDAELFDFYQDVYLMGETLAGHTPAVPSPPDYVVTGLPALQQAFGPAFPDQLNSLGETYKTSVEMLSGGKRPIYDQAWSGPLSFSGILVPQVLGSAGNGLDNTSTVYQLDSDPTVSAEEQAFNDAIVRVKGTPPQRTPAGYRPSAGQFAPELTGRLRVPVLALHTLGDLFVPFSMEQIYARKAAAAGASDMFVARAIRDINHCGFSAEESYRGFDDLVSWVKTKVRPGGDDVLDPAAVADPQFGCRYTEGTSATRVGLPACSAG